MVTKKPVPARVSKVGHYGMQYPDFEQPGVVIPRETSLRELHWIGGGDYSAFAWERDGGVSVVWVAESPLKDFE